MESSGSEEVPQHLQNMLTNMDEVLESISARVCEHYATAIAACFSMQNSTKVLLHTSDMPAQAKDLLAEAISGSMAKLAGLFLQGHFPDKSFPEVLAMFMADLESLHKQQRK